MKQKKFVRKSFFSFFVAVIILISDIFIFADSENANSNKFDFEYTNLNDSENITSDGAIILQKNELSALPPIVMKEKDIVLNPYMGSLDAAIHNDSYGTDVVNSVAPLGIYPEVAYGTEPDSYNATPNAYYDDDGRAIAAYRGGVAIKELNRDNVKVLGSFIPARDEEESYSVQTSYSFVDNNGNIVFPTSHGHIVIAKTTDNNGNVLEVFKKLMDVDVVSEVKNILGNDIDPNILSIVYDYKGNLWFVSGGFRKNPAFSKDGFIGYLSKSYIDLILNGETPNISDYIFLKRLTKGEGAENGISSCPDGTVVLTNKSCYLLTDDTETGIKIKWKVDYDSVLKKPADGSNVTGIGLAWGGGSTPTLTNDLVLFTDNSSPVKLIAISMKSGEIVASIPILESLPKTEQVSVENSILVYSSSKDKASVVICNWFGAGNSELDSPNADSSIQTYDNIYDANWMREGNKYLSPGVERVDVIKDAKGYHMEKVWTREDIRDTSMLKLSTATGYLYGYWQNLETGYWSYYILDFETGKTKLEIPVSDKPAYNNMAVGMITDINGNALYCPTNDKVLLRLRDRFVYFPKYPNVNIDLEQTSRKNINQSEFSNISKTNDIPVSYMNTVLFESIDNMDVIAFRVNGINNNSVSELKLYALDKNGNIKSVKKEKWQITDESGRVIENNETFISENLYEIRFNAFDQDEFDLCDETGKVKVSVILAKTNDSQITENSTETTTESTTESSKEPSSGRGSGGSKKGSSYYNKTETDKAETDEKETDEKDLTKSKESDNTKKIQETKNSFTDVSKNAWYAESVEYVYKNDILKGISDTLFSPDAEVTRAMTVTAFGRMDGIDSSKYTNTSYTDVSLYMYYTPYIEWASENKIVKGFGNGLFKPNESITREQLAVIIRNYFIYKGEDTSAEKTLLFEDSSFISDWAIDGVKYCYEKGIFLGDNKGMFNPKNNVSRAELAEIIMRIHK